MLLTVRQYAEKYNIPKNSVNTAIKRGKIKPVKKECGRFYLEDKQYDRKERGFSVTKDPIYTTWQNMKKRCNNPKATQYRWYGAKGIKVCPEWEKSSNAFIKWMHENGWKKGLTIDRIDSDGDYTPENCRLITAQENARRASKKRRKKN